MLEKVEWNNGAPRVALVTSVPGIVDALTGQSVAQMSDRSITRTRLRLDDLGHKITAPADTAVDLFFVPTITGSYKPSAQNNVEDLRDRLQPYDLAVDLSELTALYRRGQTPTSEIEEFLEKHGKDSRGYLEYRDFVRVITALLKLFSNVRGKIVRGRNIEHLSYEWRSDREGRPAIKNMRKAGLLLSEGDARWSALGLDVSNAITAALSPDARKALKGDLNKLVEQGLQTLQSRLMVSDYVSDLGELIRFVTGSDGKSKYVANAEAMLAKKRENFGINVESELYNSEVKGTEKEFTSLFDSLDVPLQLVDQYSISGGPEIAGFQSDIDFSLSQDFLGQLPEGMAFIKFWDLLEELNDTEAMNTTVNGWNLSNSCLPMLKQATDFGLETKFTSWSVPVLATNSVGIFPLYSDYIAAFRNAIGSGLATLLTENPAPVS